MSPEQFQYWRDRMQAEVLLMRRDPSRIRISPVPIRDPEVSK